MTGEFIMVKCPDCGNTQRIFTRPATEVNCLVCGSPLARPTGGKAVLTAEVVEEGQ
jgi:small subunit ribosomal protein S27e